MTDKKKRAERREQQAHEIEVSQKQLRESIAETDRLVGESDKMLRRHRQECEDDDRDVDSPSVCFGSKADSRLRAYAPIIKEAVLGFP